MALVAVLQQVVRPGERRAAIATRWTHPILLVPVVGAFLQILVLRHAPSIVWPVLVLVAAIATRILRARAVVTERAAPALGVDGLALEDRFVAAREIADVAQENAVVWVTTRSGERLELRVESDELESAKSTLAALARAVAAPSHDAAGEAFLADASLDAPQAAYRAPAFEAERCIALAEDAAAATHVRIAAAGLLAERGTDDTTRARIAAAAEMTASPELREALHAALEPVARAS